jgi:hypothetical protein
VRKRRNKDENARDLMYFLHMQVTADFMTSGSFHIVVIHEKDSDDALTQSDAIFEYDTINCAEEMVCVISHRSAKNEETLDIALTEGHYGIYLIDFQDAKTRNFIADNVKSIAFSTVINMYPIEDQEESIYCSGLSIPNPYHVPFPITERIVFDQRLEINFRTSSQLLLFDVVTTRTTYLRITTEQDIGMDVDIRVTDSNKNILGKGKDIGATETLVVQVNSSGLIKITLTYRNSIVRDLQACPQLHLVVASLTDTQIRALGDKQKEYDSDNSTSYQNIEKVFKTMQEAIDNKNMYTNKGADTFIYKFSRESIKSIEENIYENSLTIGTTPYWLYIEIFSDQVINDIVVNIDYQDRRFSKVTDVSKKLESGKTDELLREQKATHVFSAVLSNKDNFNIKFLSRNVMDNIESYQDQLKYVIFQMRIQLNAIVMSNPPLSMTSLLPATFNNFRDLGTHGTNFEDLRYYREHLLLESNENVINFEIIKPSIARLYLKSLNKNFAINSIGMKSGDTRVKGNAIHRNFMLFDISYNLENSGNYTLTIKITSKK